MQSCIINSMNSLDLLHLCCTLVIKPVQSGCLWFASFFILISILLVAPLKYGVWTVVVQIHFWPFDMLSATDWLYYVVCRIYISDWQIHTVRHWHLLLLFSHLCYLRLAIVLHRYQGWSNWLKLLRVLMQEISASIILFSEKSSKFSSLQCCNTP